MATPQRMGRCQTLANTNRSGDTMTVSRFDIVTLNTLRTNELSKFWADLLGLQEIEREDGDRWILLGNTNGGRTIGFQRGEHLDGSIHIDLSCSTDDFPNPKQPIEERIDTDGSSVYITTNQPLTFTPGIESQLSPPPYEGKNILLSSDNTSSSISSGLQSFFRPP